ncbi:hypothetical protein C5167_019963 [Papaver somniferum]|uniref:Uncharacterized protein n=1 Tax=Papaver somniferum TaxID=3469 RepID=A0A4Y7IVL1_PAPSO|nr:hypothetical protein C5167_019963 [Papaver somniferum]
MVAIAFKTEKINRGSELTPFLSPHPTSVRKSTFPSPSPTILEHHGFIAQTFRSSLYDGNYVEAFSQPKILMRKTVL